MNDNQIVSTIKETASRYNLNLDFRMHRNGWRTVFLEALDTPFMEAKHLLRMALADLKAAGVTGAVLTYNEAMHPRVGEPVLEVDSVWWRE